MLSRLTSSPKGDRARLAKLWLRCLAPLSESATPDKFKADWPIGGFYWLSMGALGAMTAADVVGTGYFDERRARKENFCASVRD